MTRRDSMRYLGGAASVASGLSAFIASVSGREPDGVPLTHVYDGQGKPAKARIIPEERYRRIKAYENLPKQKLMDANPKLQAITTEHGSAENDIQIKFIVEEYTTEVESSLPNSVGPAPTFIEEGEVKVDRLKGARECTQYDPIRGGGAVTQEDDGNDFGTISFTAFDQDDPNKRVLVTADHVLNSGLWDSNDVWHPNLGNCSGAREIGKDEMYSTDNDVGRAILDDGEIDSSEIGMTIDVIQDIEYYWSFSGIEDHTSNNTIPVEHGGAVTWHATNEAIGTGSIDGEVEDAVRYAEVTGEGGDSGSPIMEEDTDTLVSILNGQACLGSPSCDWRLYGCAGWETLQTANARIY